MKKLLFTIGALSVLTGAVSAQSLYAVRESDDTLVRIDISNPNAPTLNPVGPLGTPFAFGGLSMGPGGQLYMVAGRGNNALYTVDINTGAATLVGNHGITDLFGLEWDSRNNVMYATQFSGGRGLYSLSLSNGTATVINPAMALGIGGLAYNSNTDQLIGSNDGAGDLYEINRSNGAQTLLFDGPFVNDSGLTYDPVNNYLWGIDWSGVLFRYDVSNNYARTDVLTGLGAYDGLAYFAVPAPGALALLGLGGVVGARRRRR